jgi:DNA-binding transcriptional ArsR family regulator
LRHDLNIDLVFPIKDHVSAWLMRLKAEALYEAGIIDTEEMSTVLERAAAVLDKASKRAA